ALRVVLGPDEIVRVVDMGKQVVVKLTSHAGKVALAKVSPDGDQVVTYGEDRVASVWGEGVARGIDELSPYEKFRQLQMLSGPSVFASDGTILTMRVGAAKTGKEKVGQFEVFTFDYPSMAVRIEAAAKSDRHLVELADGSLVVIEPGKMIECAR